MDEKEARALVKAINQLLGEPLQADTRELDALFAEFGEGRNAAQSVFDLASKAAQKYRLEGRSVPAHLAEALDATKRAILESADAVDVIDDALNPMLGPVEEVSYAFRNRKERTERDTNLLERLSGEVKKDWSEDKES